MRWLLAAVVLALVWVALSAAHGHGSSSRLAWTARTDGWGDPYVTDAQVAGVKVGMTEDQVLRLLGDDSGEWNGQGAWPGVVGYYDYPIRGTGYPNGDWASGTATGLGTTWWWRICLRGSSTTDPTAPNVVASKRKVGPHDDRWGC